MRPVVVAVALTLLLVGCSAPDDVAPWPRTQPPSKTPAVPAADADCGPEVLREDGTPWRCVFSDDFDGDALDPTRWTVVSSARSGYRNGPECYLGADSPQGADDVRVGDGVLRLTARELPRELVCPSLLGDFTSRWSGAFVTTYDSFTTSFGRVEVRAAFPDVDVPGVHAALWLWPRTLAYGADNTGELDLAEYFSLYPDRAIPFVHYQAATTDGTWTNNACLLADPSAFHTYTMDWSPGRVRVSYDGVPCLDHVLAPAAPLEGRTMFDQAYTLNLTQALGVGTNAFTATTPLPATLTVDSVRVWN